MSNKFFISLQYEDRTVSLAVSNSKGKTTEKITFMAFG